MPNTLLLALHITVVLALTITVGGAKQRTGTSATRVVHPAGGGKSASDTVVHTATGAVHPRQARARVWLRQRQRRSPWPAGAALNAGDSPPTIDSDRGQKHSPTRVCALLSIDSRSAATSLRPEPIGDRGGKAGPARCWFARHEP